MVVTYIVDLHAQVKSIKILKENEEKCGGIVNWYTTECGKLGLKLQRQAQLVASLVEVLCVD